MERLLVRIFAILLGIAARLGATVVVVIVVVSSDGFAAADGNCDDQ